VRRGKFRAASDRCDPAATIGDDSDEEWLQERRWRVQVSEPSGHKGLCAQLWRCHDADVSGQLRLFDDLERDSRSPAKRAESQFAFLNRTGRPYFGPVRDLLEDWFSHFPPDVQPALRSRFRKDDPGQNMGAFWELYLHEAHRRLGFAIQYEPPVPGTGRSPDFLFERADERFYLEATLVMYPDAQMAARRRRDLLLDVVDEAFDQDFYVRVVTAVPGFATPRRQEYIDRIETWLAQQNWATARRAAEDGEWTAPTERFEIGGSVVVLEAHPKPDGLRGNRETPTIWAGPMEGGVFDEPVPIYKDLKAKAKAYGRPGAPYVIAALCLRDFVTSNDVEAALYGKEVVQIPIGPNGGAVGPAYLTRDFQGLWQRGQTPTYRRVTGVLSGIHIAPWTVAQNPLTLWLNPWAEHSLPNSSDLPWKTVTGDVEENALVTRDATRPPHDIFGLPDDWPGPGGPFDD
jgi:hypothetical protein